MECRAYSQKQEASWIFSDLLNHIGRRGWFSAGPSSEDGKTLLYASFHIHSDDADRVFDLLEEAVRAYGGGTKWAIDRQQQNRFVLCPIEVARKAKESGNFGKAVEEIRWQFPDLERETAVDLIRLSDFMYKAYAFGE